MNIDTLVESFYSKKDETESLINEVLSLLVTEQEQGSAEQKIDIKLPTIKFTEDWGKPDNEDRARIERYMRNIPGNTLEAKLKGLNGVLSGEVKDAGVGKILSTLIMVEILSTLAGAKDVREFTESAAGFIFEGFLAGLFGDESVQITDAEESEGQVGKPITDVILNGRHYSLKLLGPTTQLKGSYRNLINHFKDPSTNGEIIYLDARRTGDGGLDFSQFVITLEGFLEVLYYPFMKFGAKAEKTTVSGDKFLDAVKKLDNERARIIQAKAKVPALSKSNRAAVFKTGAPEGSVGFKEFKQYIEQLSEESPEELGNLNIELAFRTADPEKSKKIKKLLGGAKEVERVKAAIQSGDEQQILAALEQTRGYNSKEQFDFTRKQAESLATAEHLGTIPLGEDALRNVWSNYAQLLMTTIDPVYRNLQEFTDNVDRFFLGAGEKGGGADRKAFGEAAIKDAVELRDATDEAIKVVIKDKEEK